jgi:hypothetical protein
MSETKRANWRCYSCKGANRKESVTDEETSIEQHFAGIKKDIEKSQNFLSDKYDELLRKLEDNNEIIASMKNTIETLVGTVKEKEVIIDNLSARVNHLEQYSRNHNFEISQVQEDDHENLEDIVLTLADKMRIPLTKGDIEVVHRLPAKQGKIRSIIVQLASRKTRDEFIKKKNEFRLTNKDVVTNGKDAKIYINENLTPYNKALLFKTKTLAKEKGFSFAWFRFGKILLRKSEGSPVIKISAESDLDKLS